jgi:vitamin B12 transporter
MKHGFLLSTAAVLVGFPSIAAAAAAAEIPAVDELVVTANRSPERADRVGAQISVLDAQGLRAQQTPVLSDILSRVPGVSFSRNGGVGGATSVYIRGAEAGQSVFLIDGVRLNDATSTDNGFNFGNLLVGDIARVEVLRGPQSVLWGSQAIGGVINMITADPTAPFEADLTAEGGSHAWGYGRAGVGGKSERVTWRASAAYLTTDGISAAADGAERDGDRTVGANAKARIALTPTASADLRAIYIRGRSEFDGFTPSFTFGDTGEYGVTEHLGGYGGLNFELLGGRLKNRLAVSASHVARKNWDPAQSPFDVTFSSFGHNERYEYQGVFEVTERWTAVFGAERDDSRMRSASSFSPTAVVRSAQTDSAYLQVRGEAAPGVTLSGGVRYDDHEDFGGHTVGQASLAWRPNEGNTILRASWGQGFKAPSLYQLGSEFGNPALRPETANGWDAGVEQRFLDGRAVVSVAYFERRTKNLIDFVSCFGSTAPLCPLYPSGGYYDNVAKARARGVELSAQADLTEALSVQASYTWLDARNRTPGANFDRHLARRPSREGDAELSYAWPVKLTTAVAVHYAGDRYDDAGNVNRLKGYVTWDLRASYPLTDQVEVYGRVDNLFDERYQTVRNYGQLGRAAYGGVRARF